MVLRQRIYPRVAAIALVLAIVLIALPAVMSAQSEETPPKAEIFVGYNWLNPGGNIPDGSSPPNPYKLPSIPQGAGASLSWNFTKMLSLEGTWGINGNAGATVNTEGGGPKLTIRESDGINFFVHTLVGVQRLTSRTFGSSNGIATILGGGMDIRVWKPLSLRLFEADFVGAHHNFASAVSPLDASLRRSDFDGVWLRTGLIFNLGGAPPLTPAAACSVQNPEVMVGEPVHVSVAASNFNPKHPLTYAWSSSGGKVEGKDTAATIDTNGVAGGSYTATATVTDAKEKKNNVASCTANFTVIPPKPPQMSCSSSPSQVQAGTPSTITCSCTSPDNVPVTVSQWNATGGSISGSGNSATLGTAGASSGPITVSATCTDSRGLTTSASTTVTIENPPPPPPPPPQASKLNQCDYPNKNKPWRVDNTCKAMLDDVAGKLQQDPDAKLVVVGNADPAEVKKSHHKNLAAERAVDVKYYLTQGEAQQHIDASRIECRTGAAGTMTTEQWIIPAGATFPDASSTTPVDETKVKPIPDHPKPAAKKTKKSM